MSHRTIYGSKVEAAAQLDFYMCKKKVFLHLVWDVPFVVIVRINGVGSRRRFLVLPADVWSARYGLRVLKVKPTEASVFIEH